MSNYIVFVPAARVCFGIARTTDVFGVEATILYPYQLATKGEMSGNEFTFSIYVYKLAFQRYL